MSNTIHALFASDSFKGSLTSQKTSELLKEAFYNVFAEGQCDSIAMADGGEGTLEALQSVLHGENREIHIIGPDGRNATCTYGLLPENKAIIEMAKCAGITMVEDATRNPMNYGTYGMGQVILDALNQNCKTIYLCIGGSATMDGGIGCMQALGAQFLDQEGNALEGIARNLNNIQSIHVDSMDQRLKDTQFIVLCDVTNPLCGKDGAVYTFGAQKGADQQMMDTLESYMNHYASLLDETFGVHSRMITGGGAAGGIGAALHIFLHAQMKSGIEAVLELVSFDEKLKGIDFVVTGEGRSDWQSADGKVVSGIARHCKKYNIPVFVLCGSLGKGYEKLYGDGVTSFMTIQDRPMSLQECIQDAEVLYLNSAERMFRMIGVFKSL